MILRLNNDKESSSRGDLSVFQTLIGHSGTVKIVAWNPKNGKLTSCDDGGLVMVWMYNQGSWCEEISNNRNKSQVKDVAWNSKGTKICIVYEDGGVIVGDVDGSRIWGKEYKKLQLSKVQWSPNDHYLVFGLTRGEIHLYSDHGNFLTRVKVVCLPPKVFVLVVSLLWFCGKISEDQPTLSIAFESGHVQIMRNHLDEEPVIIHTDMIISACSWNSYGTVYAIAGALMTKEKGVAGANSVQFFTPYGEILRILNFTESGVISSCGFSGNSLHFAVAIESVIYFSSIRYQHKRCHMGPTLAYAPFNQTQSRKTAINFWNTKTNERCRKEFDNVISMSSCRHHCVLATETHSEPGKKIFRIHVCDAVGNILDGKTVNFEPRWTCMNKTHAFVASRDRFAILRYNVPSLKPSSKASGSDSSNKYRTYHVDDIPSGQSANGTAGMARNLDSKINASIIDSITCVASSEKYFLVARTSGIIQMYFLPQMTLSHRFQSAQMLSMAINCDSTNLAAIDCSGNLHVLSLRDGSFAQSVGASGTKWAMRADVWDLSWAIDDPTLLAVMEKTKLWVIHDGEPEESVNSSAYLGFFENLEIQTIFLDEIVKYADLSKVPSELCVTIEAKLVRDIREILKVGYTQAASFAEKHSSHERLWKIIGEFALSNLNLEEAESAFVKCQYYPGIRLVKKVQSMQSLQLRKARVAEFFGNFDEAEQIYLKTDRRDLAIAMREKTQDWFRIIELLKVSTDSSDVSFAKAWNNIGDYFVDKNNFQSAKEYYLKAENFEKLFTCCVATWDYDLLRRCVSILPENHPLLEKIGIAFEVAGLCEDAVESFIKLGSHELAINTCVKFNNWKLAFNLSLEYDQQATIEEKYNSFVSRMLSEKKIFDVIITYQKTGNFLEAAKLLHKFSYDNVKSLMNKPILAKKFGVLIGLFAEQYKKESTDQGSWMDLDFLENPWIVAEASHFLMLSQRQLHQEKYEQALRSAINLRNNYDEIIPREKIYCVAAFAALNCEMYDVASYAFKELEAISDTYVELAAEIFSVNPPETDNKIAKILCFNCSYAGDLWDGVCKECGWKWVFCVASGNPIEKLNEAWKCARCKHFALPREIESFQNCPLCHEVIAK